MMASMELGLKTEQLSDLLSRMDEAQTGAEETSRKLQEEMKKTQTSALIVNSDIAEKQKGLKEMGEKYEWFEVLLAKVVANKLWPAGDSKAKLYNTSLKQANIIGGALASCIAANLTAPAAVDEWMLRYPAMGELDREYVRERSERDAWSMLHG